MKRRDRLKMLYRISYYNDGYKEIYCWSMKRLRHLLRTECSDWVKWERIQCQSWNWKFHSFQQILKTVKRVIVYVD